MSRILSRLDQWTDANADATTSPIGHGPTHVYTDMIGVFKTLRANNLRVLKDGEILKSQACIFISKKNVKKKNLKKFIKLITN